MSSAISNDVIGAAFSGLIQPVMVFWLSGLVLCRLSRIQPSRDFQLTEKIGLPVAIGLGLRYALEVITGSSGIAADVCLAIAAVAVVHWGKHLLKRQPESTTIEKVRSNWPAVILFTGLSGLFSWLSIVDPIIIGDAKAIWFFHAKMIFYANGIHGDTGFADPVLLFSHPDYPKLVPVVAAAIARSVGFWNDYLPKFSAAVSLIPIFAFMGDLAGQRRYREFVVLAVAGFTGSGTLLYNGYMDGILNFWMATTIVAMTILNKSQRQPPDSSAGSLSVPAALVFTGFGMLPNIKFEGLPLAAMGCVIVFFFLRPVLPRLSVRSLRAFTFLLPLMIGFLAWRIRIQTLGLQNDMTADPAQVMRLIHERLTDQRSRSILQNYFFGDPAVWNPLNFSGFYAALPALALTGLLVALIRQIRNQWIQPDIQIWRLCIAWSTTYALFMYLVYAGTHHDLEWHLQYSSMRTLLPAQTLLLMGSLFLAIPAKKGTQND